jgi:hypothetical protein
MDVARKALQADQSHAGQTVTALVVGVSVYHDGQQRRQAITVLPRVGVGDSEVPLQVARVLAPGPLGRSITVHDHHPDASRERVRHRADG